MPLYHCAQLYCFLMPGPVPRRDQRRSCPAPIRRASSPRSRRSGRRSCSARRRCGSALLRHPEFETPRPVARCARATTARRRCRSRSCARSPRGCPTCACSTSTARPRCRRWPRCCGPEDQLRKAGSAGRPSINVETRVVDDHDQPLPPGEVGEIVHRSPHAMLGYWNDPEKTAEAFRNGWFHSGDLGVHRRRGLPQRRRPQEGHDQDRRRERRQPRGRGDDLRAPGGRRRWRSSGSRDPRWIEAVTAAVVLRDGLRGHRGRARSRSAASASPASRCPSTSCSSTSCPRTPAARSSSASCATASRRSPKPQRRPDHEPHIVIAGGGFGGLAVARTLERCCRRTARA